jgi:hypothetical protein
MPRVAGLSVGNAAAAFGALEVLSATTAITAAVVAATAADLVCGSEKLIRCIFLGLYYPVQIFFVSQLIPYSNMTG